MTYNGEMLFASIQNVEETISKEKAKEIVASLIGVLKQHQLTYSQSYKALEVTKATLSAMSELLVL